VTVRWVLESDDLDLSQPKVNEALHDIWMAATRDEAYAAFDRAHTRFSAKYPKSHGVLGQGPERDSGVLRFSSGVLDAY
jgi:hypothetical protein